MATVEQLADEVAAKVRGTFLDAYGSMKLSPDFSLFTWSDSADYAARANAQTMETIRGQIEKWASTYRTWARRGTRDDGTAYSYRQWFDYGLDLTKQALSVAGGAWADSSWETARRQLMPTEALKTAYVGTKEAVVTIGSRVSQCLENPRACAAQVPWWFWATLAGGVGLMVLSRFHLNINVPRFGALSAEEEEWTSHAKKAIYGGARAAAKHGRAAAQRAHAYGRAKHREYVLREYEKLRLQGQH